MVEEGEAVSYTVKLVAEPTGPVEVTITGAEDTTLSVDRTSLDFTVDDWNIEQEVNVSANHDDNGTDNGLHTDPHSRRRRLRLRSGSHAASNSQRQRAPRG